MTRPTDRTRARGRSIELVLLALMTGIAGGADAQPPAAAASTPAARLFTGARVIVGDGRVIVDHLHRHISTGSDLEETALDVRLAQRVGEAGGARYPVSPGLGTPGGGPNPRITNDAGPRLLARDWPSSKARGSSTTRLHRSYATRSSTASRRPTTRNARSIWLM